MKKEYIEDTESTFDLLCQSIVEVWYEYSDTNILGKFIASVFASCMLVVGFVSLPVGLYVRFASDQIQLGLWLQVCAFALIACGLHIIGVLMNDTKRSWYVYYYAAMGALLVIPASFPMK